MELDDFGVSGLGLEEMRIGEDICFGSEIAEFGSDSCEIYGFEGAISSQIGIEIEEIEEGTERRTVAHDYHRFDSGRRYGIATRSASGTDSDLQERQKRIEKAAGEGIGTGFEIHNSRIKGYREEI